MWLPWKSKTTTRYLPGFVDWTPLQKHYETLVLTRKKHSNDIRHGLPGQKNFLLEKMVNFEPAMLDTIYKRAASLVRARTSSFAHTILFTTFFMWNSGLVCKCRAIHKHVFALVFHSLVVSWSGFFQRKNLLGFNPFPKFRGKNQKSLKQPPSCKKGLEHCLSLNFPNLADLFSVHLPEKIGKKAPATAAKKRVLRILWSDPCVFPTNLHEDSSQTWRFDVRQ